jgi:phosphoserine phosphatase RsbU/P
MDVPKILVAEDHPMSRRMLEAILGSTYCVITACSGAQAVELARTENPDIVLLDVEMPDMDGFQTLEILKGEVIDQAVPVIFLTARTDSESKEKGLAAGAVDYITKPYERTELSIKVKNHLALYEARKEIEERNRIMAREMEMASQLQSLLLPQEFPMADKLDIFCIYEPLSAAGGDFYDFIELSKSTFGFVQVDVSGHGVAAAMIGAMFKMAFQSLAPTTPSPAKLLALLNDTMYRVLPDSDFLTVFYGIINSDSLEMVYTNAGHPRPLLHRLTIGDIVELSTGGMLVGAFPGAEYDEGWVRLASQDRLLIFTDGVTETFKNGFMGEPYGEARLKRVLKNASPGEPKEVLPRLVEDLDRFSGKSSFADDISVLLISIK